MGQYQKFMFDNFVIACDDAECIIEDVVEPQIEELPTVSEPIVEDVEVEHIVEEPEVIEAPVVEEIIPVITYSQEEYLAAVKQAEERGYEKGFHASAGENEALQQDLLNSLNSRMMGLMAEAEQNSEQTQKDSLKLLKEIIHHVMPSLEAEYAVAEVQKFLGDNFPNFRHESSLVFSFNPQVIKNVQEIIARLANIHDYEGKISIHKDADLGLSDCRVEWRNGSVERNAHKILEKIDNLLDDETTN